MTKTFKLVLFFVIIALAGAGLFLWQKNKNTPQSSDSKDFLRTYQNPQSLNSPAPTASPSESLSYAHPDGDFTFDYLPQYQISQLEDDQGETLLLQNNGHGLQVYISDFPANTELNSNLVRRELSGQQLDNLKDIVMPGGFNAVSFSSKDASLGNIWDVWFTRNGKFYQITSQSVHDEVLKKVVESLKFE